jgi:glycosyltransferase 2 family protein
VKKGTLLRVLLPFAISAGLLILLVNSVRGEAGQIVAALGDADWRLIPVAIALYFMAVWLRSARWGLLLPEHAVKTSALFRALVVGFTVNDLLPLRMGEVARTYLLARWCRIPYGTTMASLVVERVLDGLSLAVLLLISLALVPSAPGYLLVVGVLAVGIFLTAAALLALAAWRASAIMAVARFIARLLPARFGALIQDLADNFARSLALVHSAGRLVRLLALSLLAWCLELGLFFVMLVSFRLPASYPLALLVGSAANFATLVPSSPGYAGTFDAVLIKVLQDVASIGAVPAFSYDVVVHWVVLYIPVVVVGTLVLWRSHMSFRQITHAPDRLAPSPPRAGDERQAA